MPGPRPQLSISACIASSLGLCIGLVIATLAMLDFIEVPWDSVFWPAVMALGLVPFCLLAIVVSFTSMLINRDGLSIFSFVVGLFALGVAILATLLVVLISVANNPI